MAHLVTDNSIGSIFSRFKDMAEGKKAYNSGNMGPLQNEFTSLFEIQARPVIVAQPGNGQSVSGLESLRMGNDRIRETAYSGRVQGIGGLIKGLGEGSPYGNTPGQGATGRHGMIPRSPLSIGRLDSMMTGIGAVPQPAAGDTRGHTAKDFVKIESGHQDKLSTQAASEFDMAFAHNNDKFTIGSKDYPTKWYVVKASSPTGANKWKREFERPYDLKAGDTQTFINEEGKLKDTDVDFFVKLVWVGLSSDEIAAQQAAATEEADKIAKAKSDASAAIASANSAISSYKAIGGDTSGFDKTMIAANAAYDKADYATAMNTAKSAAIDALNAKGLLEKQNLEKQKSQIASDPTIDAATKQNMINDINAQKVAVDNKTGLAVNNAQATVPGMAVPSIGGMPTWATIAIGVGAIAGIAAIIWASRRR